VGTLFSAGWKVDRRTGGQAEGRGHVLKRRQAVREKWSERAKGKIDRNRQRQRQRGKDRAKERRKSEKKEIKRKRERKKETGKERKKKLLIKAEKIKEREGERLK
jgi:hypothetical protein